ncbi:MAG TPA: iron-sulfur cluster repair di-iron protein [bacterium]|nr:iron-sulfur cluster repair di-iron protein [bacterium]
MKTEIRKAVEKDENTTETILDVTAIESRLKHPTIFKLLDKLENGNSLIIENDHDPKPLHYQLSAEKKNMFSWEYLENGPVKWVVKITKKGPSGDNETDSLLLKSVGEIASENPEKIEVFKKYGLDFCCGGNKTLGEACTESGTDEKAIVNELNNANKHDEKTENNKNYALNQRANEWDVSFLIDYIVNIHHTFLRIHLPEASEYMEKVIRVHGEHHPELVKIKELFAKMNETLIPHLDKEEEELFPHMKNGETGDSMKKEISDAEYDHEYVGRILKEMSSLSFGYAVPEDACASYKYLYGLLKDIADDIMIHIHLENNILFKKI